MAYPYHQSVYPHPQNHTRGYARRAPHYAPYAPARGPRPNFKEQLVEHTYNAIKSVMQQEGLWVDLREEDEGFYTIRIHAKKQSDIAIVPIIIQKVVSEIGVVEFSMHYLKRPNLDKKFGLTIYIRMQKSSADVDKAIREFANFKIHARCVRTMPEEMKSKDGSASAESSKVAAPKRKAAGRTSSMMVLLKQEAVRPGAAAAARTKISLASLKPSRSSKKGQSPKPKSFTIIEKSKISSRDFPDEDPELDEDEEETDEYSGSEKVPSITKPKRQKSRTISVLVPNRKPEDVLELKFENGATKKIKVRGMSTKSKSIPKIDAEKALASGASRGHTTRQNRFSWSSSI